MPKTHPYKSAIYTHPERVRMRDPIVGDIVDDIGPICVPDLKKIGWKEVK